MKYTARSRATSTILIVAIVLIATLLSRPFYFHACLAVRVCRRLEIFFSFEHAAARTANAGQFPRCRRGRHRTALPRSVIAQSAAIFLYFYFARGLLRAGKERERGEGRGGGGESAGSWRESLKNHASRDGNPVEAGHWFPIFPQRAIRALEGHNPRA